MKTSRKCLLSLGAPFIRSRQSGVKSTAFKKPTSSLSFFMLTPFKVIIFSSFNIISALFSEENDSKKMLILENSSPNFITSCAKIIKSLYDIGFSLPVCAVNKVYVIAEFKIFTFIISEI